MKSYSDSMALQQRRDILRLKSIDYKNLSNKVGIYARYLFECSIKLKMKPLTSATAAVIYHRFFRETNAADYDHFLIATSALYMASKIKDDSIKVRDIINVAYNTINKGSSPLELGDTYWEMRDAIVQAELLITRMIKFELTTVHPHKYMLYYIKSLQDWYGFNEWNALPISKIAAGFLQDFHHSPSIIDYKPSHIAICCLSLAMQTYGVQVPLTDDYDDVWYNAFSKDLTRELHWEILEKIMEVYNFEAEIDEHQNNQI